MMLYSVQSDASDNEVIGISFRRSEKVCMLSLAILYNGKFCFTIGWNRSILYYPLPTTSSGHKILWTRHRWKAHNAQDRLNLFTSNSPNGPSPKHSRCGASPCSWPQARYLVAAPPPPTRVAGWLFSQWTALGGSTLGIPWYTCSDMADCSCHPCVDKRERSY